MSYHLNRSETSVPAAGLVGASRPQTRLVTRKVRSNQDDTVIEPVVEDGKAVRRSPPESPNSSVDSTCIAMPLAGIRQQAAEPDADGDFFRGSSTRSGAMVYPEANADPDDRLPVRFNLSRNIEGSAHLGGASQPSGRGVPTRLHPSGDDDGYSTLHHLSETNSSAMRGTREYYILEAMQRQMDQLSNAMLATEKRNREANERVIQAVCSIQNATGSAAASVLTPIQKTRDEPFQRDTRRTVGLFTLGRPDRIQYTVNRDGNDRDLPVYGQGAVYDTNHLGQPTGRTRLAETFFPVTSQSAPTLTMYVERPDQSHLKFKDRLSVHSVMKFIDDCEEYLSVNRRMSVSLEPASLLSRSIRESMVSRYAKEGLTSANFFMQRDETLFTRLSEMVRPTSEQAFIDVLEQIPFNWKGPVSAENAEVYIRKVVAFIEKFARYIEFMSIDNDQYIPETRDCEGGLIRIFLSKLPNSFGRNLYAEISKQRRNFIEFSEFMQLFRILCERSIQETIAAENTLARFASRKTSSDARVTPAEEKPTRSAGYVKRDEKRPARTAFPSKFHSLHEDLEQEDMQDGMYPADPEYVESEPYGEQADNMFAVDHKANKDYTKSGCFRFAVYGHCERKDCNRSHETKACEDMLKSSTRLSGCPGFANP